MCIGKRGFWSLVCSLGISLFLMTPMAFAGEADIKLPDLTQVSFMGGSLGGLTILNLGLVICAIGMIFGWLQYIQTKNLPAHQAMLDVSNTIWETCKTYLFQQGKFLAGLWVLIAICMVYYFMGLQGNTDRRGLDDPFLLHPGHPRLLRRGLVRHPDQHRRQLPGGLRRPERQSPQHGEHLSPLRHERRPAAGQRRAVLHDLILAFLPKDLAGPCFIGFAIGESLGASALRICGGIFTKIADIGSDLMKIIFKLPEDDPKNPGVIADCTGDNAGDSVGPTADGFETYGVTGVALIAFLALALADQSRPWAAS